MGLVTAVCCIKLRSLGGEGQFLSLVSKFLGDRRQHVRLDGKVSATVDGVCCCCCLDCAPPSSSTTLGTI